MYVAMTSSIFACKRKKSYKVILFARHESQPASQPGSEVMKKYTDSIFERNTPIIMDTHAFYLFFFLRFNSTQPGFEFIIKTWVYHFLFL